MNVAFQNTFLGKMDVLEYLKQTLRLSSAISNLTCPRTGDGASQKTRPLFGAKTPKFNAYDLSYGNAGPYHQTQTLRRKATQFCTAWWPLPLKSYLV